MQLLVLLSVVLLLMVIIYQDFRYRAVLWIIFPLLAALLVFLTPEIVTQKHYLPNLIFLLFINLTLTMYFSRKEKKLVNITEKYLGLGDILFLAVLCFAFSPVNYILFFIGSLFGVIVSVLVFRKIQNNIPLAGLQAALFLILMGLDSGIENFNLTDDSWLISFL